MRRQAILCAALGSLVACSDHRYGFFGDEEGATTGSPDSTDGREPDPTGAPGIITVTTQPDPGGSDPDGSDPGEPDPDPDPTGASGVCGEVVLPTQVPLHIEADNTGGPTLFGLTCGLESASEAVFVWTAPFDGVFRFDTAASSFDTVLAVTQDYCGGPEIGCNDDALGLFSAVTTPMSAGQMVTIVVEGRQGEQGPVILNIEEEPQIVCTFADLGSELGEFVGSTTFGQSILEGSCGGQAANEAAFLWRAPFSGLFRFQTVNSGFDPVLYVLESDCDGLEIMCSDDFASTEASLDLFADEGELLLVVVDGFGPGQAGQYTLRILAN